MANNIDKKEPVTNCEQSKIDIIKCDNHELAGNIEPLIKVIRVAKTEHSHPLGMVVSTHFRCGKGVKRGLKNGALPFNID